MALLVYRFHQPLDQAWRFTFREFSALVAVHQPKAGPNFKWDHDKLADFQRHLRDKGMKL